MKTKKQVKKPSVKEILLVDESISIHRKKGNGVIRRQIWVDQEGDVTRYNMTYINFHLFHGDNGRVFGYDNAHGYHHRHYMGKVEPIDFNSLEELEIQFQKEFEVLHEQVKKK